jgi:hypothetical protein
MRMLPICTAVTGIGLQILGPAQEFQPTPPGVPRVVHAAHARVAAPGPDRLGDQELTEVIERYCVTCHNDQRLTGNLSLEDFRVDGAAARAETAEKMIVKLRAGMMPPSGRRRPAGDTLPLLVENLEATLDEAAEQNRNPGIRSFQRLNREEYEASIRDLLGLEIDAGAYLPLDTKSANFDNIADVQMLSPMLLSAYLTAASEISRLAVGDASVLPSETNYAKEGYYSQWERSDGAPYGTRGGVSALHNFPADGLYLIKMAFDHTTTGGFYGNIAQGEQIEISIDGARVALIEVDQFMHQQDPNAVNMESEPFPVRAGPHQVSAVFLQRFEGPIVDLMSPFDWSLVDRRIGADGYGITALPHMKDMSISGPFDVTGISDTPTRQRIFSCRPTSSSEAPGCAREIVERLATRAYRRLTTEQEVAN